MKAKDFKEFFRKATGKDPFPYQVRLAVENPLPDILHLPTGSGKTYAIIAAWLWRRKHGNERHFPRRLVYCLPVRVLVEQTYEVTKNFLKNAGFSNIGVYKLLGGEVEEEWHYSPEKEVVIIGTQDMLLSRALNRGFAQSRFAWPLDFALLNNDCLWVFDEIQLMGSGLATSTELAAFRQELGVYGECRSIWLSATLNIEWLKTVDFTEKVDKLKTSKLMDDDFRNEKLVERMSSKKVLKSYKEEWKAKKLAKFLKDKHQPGTITLAVLNTVNRATDLYKNLKDSFTENEKQPDIILIHSRFRGAEREEKAKAIYEKSIPPEGRIIISTQIVEAGVDISSAVLFTELAPWPAIVQRLGRCNRYGEYEEAEAIWIDLDEKNYPPYEKQDMDEARGLLKKLENISLSPASLQDIEYKTSPKYRFVVRRKDIEELYDNTPDLSGYDIDVSRFIRDLDSLDLQVFWRDFQNEPGKDVAIPSQREICPVPFFEFREWLEKAREERKPKAYIWDHLEERWKAATQEMVWPGTLVLLPCQAGGYDPEYGWSPQHENPVEDISEIKDTRRAFESTSSDDYGEGARVTLREHSKKVRDTLAQVINHLKDMISFPSAIKEQNPRLEDLLLEAALLHDIGKASSIFQERFVEYQENPPDEPLAKGRMRTGEIRNKRKYFRHELVSALLVIQNRGVFGDWASSEIAFNLVAYLIAAHHGKVRCAIRALPNEDAPDDGRRFALGVWEGDVVEELQIGNYRFPPTELNLECIELGYSSNGDKSWVERCADLLDVFGPFRLAYLEALLRSADVRASMEEKRYVLQSNKNSS